MTTIRKHEVAEENAGITSCPRIAQKKTIFKVNCTELE